MSGVSGCRIARNSGAEPKSTTSWCGPLSNNQTRTGAGADWGCGEGGGGRFVAQSAAADLVAQRLRPRGSSRDRQPAGLVYSVRGSLYLEGWMRPKQTTEGTPEESRPDGERRAEVTKNLGEMVVGQQRRGDRGASVRTPAGMGSYDMNDWKLSSSRLQMLARSKEQVQRQGTKMQTGPGTMPPNPPCRSSRTGTKMWGRREGGSTR